MTTFLTDAGYWALIVFAFVQACCIPISSEITFGFAGVLAYEGHLSLALVIIIGTLAELAGSTTAYGLGRLGGRHTVERYRRYLLMTRRDVERVERFFAGLELDDPGVVLINRWHPELDDGPVLADHEVMAYAGLARKP